MLKKRKTPRFVQLMALFWFFSVGSWSSVSTVNICFKKKKKSVWMWMCSMNSWWLWLWPFVLSDHEEEEEEEDPDHLEDSGYTDARQRSLAAEPEEDWETHDWSGGRSFVFRISKVIYWSNVDLTNPKMQLVFEFGFVWSAGKQKARSSVCELKATWTKCTNHNKTVNVKSWSPC